MLHPRVHHPQLGFSFYDIPVLGPVAHSAVSLLQGDVCGAIPFGIIPGLKDLASQIGCTPIARDALVVALTAKGGPAVAAVGSTVVAQCLCSGKLGPGPNIPPPAPPAPSVFSNPLVWAGLGLAVVAVAMSSKKRKPAPARSSSSGSTSTDAEGRDIDIHIKD